MTEANDAIVIHRTIAASPERLFRAFTRPEQLARWMSPVGHAEVEVDLRLGGALRVAMIGDGVRIEHIGQFLELDPPHRLAFTWQSDYTGGVAAPLGGPQRGGGGGQAAPRHRRGGGGGALLPTPRRSGGGGRPDTGPP